MPRTFVSSQLQAARQDLNGSHMLGVCDTDGGSRRLNGAQMRVKPTKFDGSTSWSILHCHFKAVANHNTVMNF